MTSKTSSVSAQPVVIELQNERPCEAWTTPTSVDYCGQPARAAIVNLVTNHVKPICEACARKERFPMFVAFLDTRLELRAMYDRPGGEWLKEMDVPADVLEDRQFAARAARWYLNTYPADQDGAA